MGSLRWEAVPLLRPWSMATEAAIGVPIASGVIFGDDDLPQGERIPSDPIALPAAPDGAPFLLLRMEVSGHNGWLVTVGPPGSTPDAGHGAMPATDEVPRIWIPPSFDGGFSMGRPIEVRAVKPRSVFVARM